LRFEKNGLLAAEGIEAATGALGSVPRMALGRTRAELGTTDGAIYQVVAGTDTPLRFEIMSLALPVR